jgi:ankyrin repeat protein
MIPHVSDVNVQGDIGNTPLHYAVSNRQFAMVEELLAYGADPAKGNDYGDMPLEYMASEPMLTQLLNRLKPA